MSDASGGVFVSYRRLDARSSAGRIYDRAADRFGKDQVFMDVSTIKPGVDFAQVITQAVSMCKVLLAVIGPRWVTATDEEGRRRLDDLDDLVRLEIAAALERDIRVIPILVEDATMPRRHELPENLAQLAGRNAHRVRHESFDSDTAQLLTAIEHVLRSAAGGIDSTDVVREPSAVHVVRHHEAVNRVTFSPGGGRLATASEDKTARVWVLVREPLA